MKIKFEDVPSRHWTVFVNKKTFRHIYRCNFCGKFMYPTDGIKGQGWSCPHCKKDLVKYEDI